MAVGLSYLGGDGMAVAHEVGFRMLSGLAVLSMLLLGFASQAQAQETIINQRTPITFAATNPCTLESVVVEGTFHFISKVTEDESGGLHTVTHITTIGHGVTPDGVRYTVQDRNNAHNKLDLESADNSTLIANFHVVRQGDDTPTEDDYILRVTFHLTENANGEPTAMVSNVESECR
jgi:hypothetical protein